jgi:hypothetical protein
MAKKEIIIGILVHNRSKIYCNDNMLHSSSIDEENLAGYIGGI